MSNYSIHADYQNLRIGDVKFSRSLMLAVNTLTKTQNIFRKRHPDVDYKTHHVLGKDNNKIKLELIRPKGLRPSRCIVHYSGGAFCVGPQPCHYEKAELYAINTNCTVIFVSYRLAPKHPFPAGLNDCLSALQWTLDHAAEQAINPDNIILLGDSAGGFMSAAIAQMALDQLDKQPKAQVLIYPVTDSTCTSQSALEFKQVPVFSSYANKSMWQAYLGELDRNNLPAYASPLRRENMQGLPPAYIETAEFDPLRDEGIAYAERLQAAGVVVELHNTKGTVHGYDIYAKNALYIDAIKRRCNFLNTAFSQP